MSERSCSNDNLTQIHKYIKNRWYLGIGSSKIYTFLQSKKSSRNFNMSFKPTNQFHSYQKDLSSQMRTII